MKNYTSPLIMLVILFMNIACTDSYIDYYNKITVSDKITIDGTVFSNNNQHNLWLNLSSSEFHKENAIRSTSIKVLKVDLIIDNFSNNFISDIKNIRIFSDNNLLLAVDMKEYQNLNTNDTISIISSEQTLVELLESLLAEKQDITIAVVCDLNSNAFPVKFDIEIKADLRIGYEDHI